MAVSHQSFTVGTTPILIVDVPEGNPLTEICIINDDNNTIYIGDSAVTSSSGIDKGLPVAKGTVHTLHLNAEDKLYAVAATATGAYAVSVLYSKVIG